MKPSFPSFAVAVAGAAFALGLVWAGPSHAQSPSPQPSAAASPGVVHIAKFTYVPAVLTVPAGTTVTFINDDSTAHTVTASDQSFDSKNMDQHQSWSHLFDRAGTYAYVCAYHAFMKGQIIVK